MLTDVKCNILLMIFFLQNNIVYKYLENYRKFKLIQAMKWAKYCKFMMLVISDVESVDDEGDSV